MPTANYEQHAFVALQRERAERCFALPHAEPPQERYHPIKGYRIHLDEQIPKGPPRGTVLLLHGAGAHGRALSVFGAPLVARGFRVIAPDLPGYGLTQGDASHTSYAEWIEIVRELTAEAAQEGPVVLYGLSAGGMVALLAAQAAGVASAVIATTLLDLSEPATFDAVARRPWLSRLARALFRRVSRPFDPVALPLRWLIPIETLTSDPELSRLLLRDPWVGGRRRPLRFFRSLHEYTPPAELDPGCPVLLVHPGADLWTPHTLSTKVFARIRGPKEYVLLSNGSHAPLESPAFAELTAAVERFLDATVPQQS